MHCRHANSSAISCLKAGQSAQLFKHQRIRDGEFQCQAICTQTLRAPLPRHERWGRGCCAQAGEGTLQRWKLAAKSSQSAPKFCPSTECPEEDLALDGAGQQQRWAPHFCQRTSGWEPTGAPWPMSRVDTSHVLALGEAHQHRHGQPPVACPKRLASPSMEIDHFFLEKTQKHTFPYLL